jgi:hypothetical protein
MLPPPLETRPPLASRSLAATATGNGHWQSSSTSSSSSAFNQSQRNINDDDDDLIVIDDPNTALPGDSATKADRSSHDQALCTLTHDSALASDASGANHSSVVVDAADRLVPFDALPLPSAYAALLAAFVAFEVRCVDQNRCKCNHSHHQIAQDVQSIIMYLKK